MKNLKSRLAKSLLAAAAAIVVTVFAAPEARADGARTWYVNGATGLDTNTGCEETNSFKTIAKALSSAVDGETILVSEGTYKEGYYEDGGKSTRTSR